MDDGKLRVIVNAPRIRLRYPGQATGTVATVEYSGSICTSAQTDINSYISIITKYARQTNTYVRTWTISGWRPLRTPGSRNSRDSNQLDPGMNCCKGKSSCSSRDIRKTSWPALSRLMRYNHPDMIIMVDVTYAGTTYWDGL
eukprot:jgi/Botrbrau1/16497/Bobra.0142s0091.1